MLGLAAVTLLVFWPVVGFEFTDLDDQDYVTANVHVLKGLTWGGIGWAFTTLDAGFWQPTTWLSCMADATVWGKGAGGFHFTNLLLHAANSVLLLALLRQLTGALWRSALVAALFALHPLHVEPVAWIASRKDVLSTFFEFLALIFYARYAGSQIQNSKFKIQNYGLSLLFFALGLMSKTMVVTLPFLMLLLDYWPLRRVSSVKCQVSSAVQHPPPSAIPNSQFIIWWRLVSEKLPFLALAIFTGLLTVLAEKRMGALPATALVPMKARLANAFLSYGCYLWQTLWPAKLAVYYPYLKTFSMMWVLVAGFVVVTISALALWQVRQRPYLAVGWFWYVIMLLPVIGLVQVGLHAHADRYAYVPLIGAFIILVWGANELLVRRPRLKIVAGAVAVLVLCACAARTRDQLGYWRNSETLYRHALAVTKDNWLAYNNLGMLLADQGDTSAAMDCLQKALQIKPDYAEARNNVGIILAREGKFAEAIPHYIEALRLAPDSAPTQNSLGYALEKLGRLDEAVAHYNEALRLKPDFVEVHNNLGNLLVMRGELDQAIAHFRAALRYNPDYVNAHSNLGVALAAQGRYVEAIPHYREALRLEPGSAIMHNNLGYALMKLGRLDEAMTHYTEALRLQPDYAPAHLNMGCALAQSGRRAEAIVQLSEAMRLRPDDNEAKQQLRALGVPVAE